MIQRVQLIQVELEAFDRLGKTIEMRIESVLADGQPVRGVYINPLAASQLESRIMIIVLDISS